METDRRRVHVGGRDADQDPSGTFDIGPAGDGLADQPFLAFAVRLVHAAACQPFRFHLVGRRAHLLFEERRAVGPGFDFLCEQPAVGQPGAFDIHFVAERYRAEARHALALELRALVRRDPLAINDEILAQVPFRVGLEFLGLRLPCVPGGRCHHERDRNQNSEHRSHAYSSADRLRL